MIPTVADLAAHMVLAPRNGRQLLRVAVIALVVLLIAAMVAPIGAFGAGTTSQTITFDPIVDQTYGVAPIALTATASSLLPVTYAANGQCTVAGSTATVTGAGPCSITASQAGDATWAAAPDVTQPFTVGPAQLTVTAPDATMVFGTLVPTPTPTPSPTPTPTPIPTPTLGPGATPTFGPGATPIGSGAAPTFGPSPSPPPSPTVFNPIYTGFVNGDTPSSLTSQPTCTTSATQTSPVGTYPITCSGGVSANYSFIYVAGSLTVTPQAGSTDTGANVVVAPAITGGSAPNITVTFAQVTTGGTTSVALSSAGPATPGSFQLAASPTYYDVSTTAAYSSSITVCLPYDPTAYSDPSLVRLLHWNGTSWDDVTTSLDQINFLVCGTTASLSPFVVVQKLAPLAVIAPSASRAYGAANPTLTAAYSGFVNGDTAASLTTQPICTTTAGSLSPVGTYPITCSGTVDHNYTFTYVAGTLTVVIANRYWTPVGVTLNVSAPGFLALTNVGSSTVVVSQAPKGRLTLGSTPGSFAYAPLIGWRGTDSFSYELKTGGHLSSPVPVTIYVLGAGLSCLGCNLSGLQPGALFLVGANLGNANLTGTGLDHAYLIGANLSGATLIGANLTGATLIGASLPNSNLTGAILSGANLIGANLSGANLTMASVHNADLIGANLTHALLTGADLSGSILLGVSWAGATCPDGTAANSHHGTCLGHLSPLLGLTLPTISGSSLLARTNPNATANAKEPDPVLSAV
jgi:hypothetical protein